MALKIGSKAPDFKLKGTSGGYVDFYAEVRSECILYFYPADFTPGCTVEACEYRDDFDFFKALEIPVFGISKDSVETHVKFSRKLNLPFQLLSDPSGAVIRDYKAMFPIIQVPKRISYFITAEKKVAGVFKNLLRFQEHVKQMKEVVTKTEQTS